MKSRTNIIIRQTTILLICFVAAITTAARPVRAADLFMDVATNPSFLRDVHVVTVGGYLIASAHADGGQNTGISYSWLGGGSNIWNNEHNQVLAGIQYGRREFDQKITLPSGFGVPERFDTVSASFLYKHITSGDWSLSQSVRYTRSWTNTPSISVKDSFDFVGLAAVSRKPGVAWAFGYIITQTDSLDPVYLPVVEYVNAAHDQWVFTIGFPVLSLAYSPHPDVMLGGMPGGGAGIAYKVTEQNILRLSFAGDSWAYRLAGSNVKGIAYTAQHAGLDWTYLYYIDHRTVVILNASLGWEFNRKLGSDLDSSNKLTDKITMGDAAVMGFNASLAF